MLRERHPLSNKKEKDKIHLTITVMGWSQHSNSQLYQQVCLVSHGAVEVSRPSKVEQAKSKLTVGYNVDVNSSVLHRKRRVQKMREREIRREDKESCQVIHPANLHFSLVYDSSIEKVGKLGNIKSWGMHFHGPSLILWYLAAYHRCVSDIWLLTAKVRSELYTGVKQASNAHYPS